MADSDSGKILAGHLAGKMAGKIQERMEIEDKQLGGDLRGKLEGCQLAHSRYQEFWRIDRAGSARLIRGLP